MNPFLRFVGLLVTTVLVACAAPAEDDVESGAGAMARAEGDAPTLADLRTAFTRAEISLEKSFAGEFLSRNEGRQCGLFRKGEGVVRRPAGDVFTVDASAITLLELDVSAEWVIPLRFKKTAEAKVGALAPFALQCGWHTYPREGVITPAEIVEVLGRGGVRVTGPKLPR